MKDKSESAFPYIDEYNNIQTHGMTLRDWFAGQALSGILADSTIRAINVDIAIKVYDMADSMLAERDK